MVVKKNRQSSETRAKKSQPFCFLFFVFFFCFSRQISLKKLRKQNQFEVCWVQNKIQNYFNQAKWFEIWKGNRTNFKGFSILFFFFFFLWSLNWNFEISIFWRDWDDWNF